MRVKKGRQDRPHQGSSAMTGKAREPVFRRPAGSRRAAISIVVQPGALMTSLAGVVEPMAAANEILGTIAYDFRLHVAKGNQVRLGSGMIVVGPPLDLAGPDPQNLVLVGGEVRADESHHRAERSLRAALCRWSSHGTKVVAVGDSVFTAFAALGTPAAASVFWSRRAVIQELHPDLETRETLYTLDSRVTTCAGRSGTFDMVLSDVHAVHGRATASRVAQALLIGCYREGQGGQRAAPVADRTTANETLRAAVATIEENLEAPISIAELSSQLNISLRQLERLFKAEYGISPVRYYLNRRIEHAHDLLLFTRLSVSEISFASGFSSVEQFCRRYRELKGMGPGCTRIAAAG